MSPRTPYAACRTDGNQTAVVEALNTEARRLGEPMLIQSLAAVGCGCPDLLVLFRGAVTMLEIKDGAKIPSARTLTDAEKSWHARAERAGCKVEIVDSAEAAVVAILGYAERGVEK